MDNTSFHLKYAPDQKLNVRLIENTDPKSIIRGNVGDLLTVLNDLAYIDVENDAIEYIKSTPEAMKLYKLTQFGLQYMMFTVSKLGDNVLLLKDYIKIQEDKKNKMSELLHQQEETLKRLRNKKKTLADAEKQYTQILKTLNIDPHVGESKENNGRHGGNVPVEGDSARVSNNIPKKSIMKKKSDENNFDRPSGENLRRNQEPEYTTSQREQSPEQGFKTLKDKFAELPTAEKNEFRRFVIQESFGKAPPQFGDISEILSSQKLGVKDSNDMLPTTKNIEEPAKSKVTNNSSNIKIEDQEKEEGEIYEDDYEDDFELSQSQVKSTYLAKSSQLKESGYNGDETTSFDVSTVTQKNFDGNYMDKLDRLVSKNKGDVELNLKDFSK